MSQDNPSSTSVEEILRRQLAEECAEKYRAYKRITELEEELKKLRQQLVSG